MVSHCASLKTVMDLWLDESKFHKERKKETLTGISQQL
jgi:hypothetical protein